MLEALKFLITGPLISIYRELVEIKELLQKVRRHQVASYEDLTAQLTALGGQVDSIKTELGSDIARLQEVIANSANVPAAVVEAANSLAAKIDSLQTLDVPNPEPETPVEPNPPAEPESGTDQFA